MLSSDVLPAPLGPMIEAICPCLTAIDTPSTARTPPKRFDAPSTTSCSSSRAVVEPLAAAPAIRFVSSRGRRMRLGYGRHDADEIAIKQPTPAVAPPLRLAVARPSWNDASVDTTSPHDVLPTTVLT